MEEMRIWVGINLSQCFDVLMREETRKWLECEEERRGIERFCRRLVVAGIFRAEEKERKGGSSWVTAIFNLVEPQRLYFQIFEFNFWGKTLLLVYHTVCVLDRSNNPKCPTCGPMLLE